MWKRKLAARRARTYDNRMSILTGVLLVLIIAGCMALAACLKKEKPPTEEERRQAEIAQRKENLQLANDLPKDFLYLYDDRSERCFVYLWRTWGGGEIAVGGPALTDVPCTAKVRALVVNPPAAWSAPPAPLAPLDNDPPTAEAPPLDGGPNQ